MAETKPTKVARWATDGGTTVEPAAGEKNTGWAIVNKPPARFMNWLHNVAYQWFNWFNERMFDGGSSKDFEIRGVDIVAGTDVDGGDLELGGGSSTGDGGSEVNFKVAKAGQGAGAAVRSPDTVGRFNEAGKFEVHNGTSWEKMVPEAKVGSDLTDDVASTTTETAFAESYTIPANTLKQGTTIRIRATGREIGAGGAFTANFFIRLGTGALTGRDILFQTPLKQVETFSLDVAVTYDPATNGVRSGGQALIETPGSSPDAEAVVDANINTTLVSAANEITVSVDFAAVVGGRIMRLDQLIIDIT